MTKSETYNMKLNCKLLSKYFLVATSVLLFANCSKESPCGLKKTQYLLKDAVVNKLETLTTDEIPSDFAYILRQEDYQQKVFDGIRYNLVVDKLRTQFSTESSENCTCTVREKFQIPDSIRQVAINNNKYLIDNRITFGDALAYIDNVDDLIYNVQVTDNKTDTIVSLQKIDMGKTIVAAFLSKELEIKGAHLAGLNYQYKKSEQETEISLIDTRNFLSDNIGRTMYFKQFIPVDPEKINGPKHKFSLKLTVFENNRIQGEYSFEPGYDIDSWSGEFQGAIEDNILNCTSWEYGEGNTTENNFQLYLNSSKAKIIFENNYFIMDYFG